MFDNNFDCSFSWNLCKHPVFITYVVMLPYVYVLQPFYTCKYTEETVAQV
jgi:hypothetical protein